MTLSRRLEFWWFAFLNALGNRRSRAQRPAEGSKKSRTEPGHIVQRHPAVLTLTASRWRFEPVCCPSGLNRGRGFQSALVACGFRDDIIIIVSPQGFLLYRRRPNLIEKRPPAMVAGGLKNVSAFRRSSPTPSHARKIEQRLCSADGIKPLNRTQKRKPGAYGWGILHQPD